MNFIGKIVDGELIFTETQIKLRKQYLSEIKNNTCVTEKITKSVLSKTYQQIKTIFGFVLATIINQFNDNGWDSSIVLNTSQPTGVPVSTNLLKEFLYAVCPIETDDGERITLSKASIGQAAKFIDNIRNYAASQWGIVVPEPDPNWKEKQK